MSAPIAFDVRLTDPAVRATQLSHDHHAALMAARAQAEQAHVPTHGNAPISRLFYAGCALAGFWERRVKRVERVFRWLLASDHLTDEQRTEMVEVLHGRQHIGRDPKILDKWEATLLEHYRGMDANGKQMLRSLLARMSGQYVHTPTRRERLREVRDTGTIQNLGKPVIDIGHDDREGA